MGGRARAVVEDHQASVAAPERRRGGVHYTPGPLADLLVGLALDALGRRPEAVCDPACGAGSFLLSAADALAATGLAPTEVLDRLAGADLDPDAVAAARRALAAWAEEHGLPPHESDRVELRVADTLLDPPPGWTARFDLVVGNPPFLGQLSGVTARDARGRAAVRDRYPEAGPYADSAALFLVAAVDLTAVDGVVMLLQPQSVLSSRDTRGVRDRLVATADLACLWASDERCFDADVEVCAPVLRVRSRHAADRPPPGAAPGTPRVSRAPSPWAEADRGTVPVRWGQAGTPAGSAPHPLPGASWGPVLAPALGIPAVRTRSAGRVRRVGELAGATAGFREEFYALAAAAREPGDDGWDPAAPRLVTVGMIDPGRISWGTRPRRLGGRSVVSPRVDLAALRSGSPKAAAWARRRLRPKVLVATQTRVLEAVADPEGDCLPVTPTISVEPGAGTDLWALTAALMAPTVSARAAAEHLGSGLSVGAVRWSASAVADVELPVDHDAWGRGAVLARRLAAADGSERMDLLGRLGRTMCEAHGVDPDDDVAHWWFQRARRA